MPSTASLFLGTLATLTLVAAVMTSDPCVAPCSCNRKFVKGYGAIFRLECSHRANIREMPDLSGLSAVGGPLSLTLAVGKLSKLQRQDFPSGLPIVSIDLFGNTELDSDVFQNVRGSLSELQLYNLRLDLNSSLRLLHGLRKLQNLVLVNVSGSLVPQHLTVPLFEGLGLENLETLQLSGNNIASVGPEVFRGLRTEALSISNDKLVEFPGAALRKVKDLKSLVLYRNKLQRLRKGDTDGLGLEKLRLEHNELVEIEEGALTGLRDHLKIFKLNNNKLERVPTAALAPLRKLKNLDLAGNPIANVSRALEGDYCLTHLSMGNFDDFRLRHIADDAFNGGGKCMEFLTLYNTGLTDFPSGALRSLTKAMNIAIFSDSLTRLKTGALSGVHVWGLSLTAPIDTIEKGAFNGMTFYPVALRLQGSKLSNLSFFFDYPAGTFIEIYVTGDDLPCDCHLAEVKYNLEHYDLSSPAAAFKSLAGECTYEGRTLAIQPSDVGSIFSQCTNFTTLPLREGLNGGGVLGASSVMLLLMLLVFASVMLQ